MLIRPLINEKSFALIKNDFYTFEVSKEMTKLQVARLVAEKFKVDPIKVNIINIKGKKRMQRSRKGYFKTADTKKAIVKLKKGQKIAIFEVASEQTEEVTVTTAEGEPIAKSKEKKSLLRGTKVKIEKEPVAEKHEHTREQAGKTKGEG